MGAIRTQWFRLIVLAILLAGLVVFAASTRYEYHQNQFGFWRVDRWTGTPELQAGGQWFPAP